MSREDQRSSFCKIKGSSKSIPFLQCYSSVDQLQLKSGTPVENSSHANPLTSTFAKRSPGAQANYLLRRKKRMESLITSHQESWWRSKPPPSAAKDCVTNLLWAEEFPGFFCKQDKVPQSICCLQMAPLRISENRTHTVKWSMKQGESRGTTLVQDWTIFKDLRTEVILIM